MLGFEQLCSNAVTSYEQLSSVDVEMDVPEMVALTVDSAMVSLTDPIAVVDLVVDHPEILDWKVPDTSESRPLEGAEYVKAAVRVRLESHLIEAVEAGRC